MRALPEKPWFMAASAASLIAGFLLISSFLRLGGDRNLLCSVAGPPATGSSVELLTSAVLHYATSSVTPQQSRSEIRISYSVLRARSPCNFLVFGLGHDSLMWQSFNPGGTTVFLEEDPKWVQSVLRDAPSLHAHTVRYPTKLKEADDLLTSWRSEPACDPARAALKGNTQCRLALAGLPNEIYEKEWDLIMIDAPRGYFAEAPGRMGAIYSAALMARNRKGAGPTDVFLHDVDRKVEKAFAAEFLCKKHLVEGKGRLWHFRIPAVPGNETTASSGGGFC
ncbi:putative methyltransferase At1g27930 [Iris pallida]|uniref:Methyltransferase At1g27930 n=1 Tax=Iris pallida TaxID=29817 RepID=A0AAX6EZU1_IRIPA|nr:putative methyltransferase At1g27930 [Iris pallida]